MKYIYTAIAICVAFIAHAQKAEPQLLRQPADWSFERFALPPEFAPGFPYHGAEELRFAPGMFKRDAPDYFSYAFVAQLDSTGNISKKNVEDYLRIYFKGLCSSTAKERKLVIDTALINVTLSAKLGKPANLIIYYAVLNVFGVFADGAPVQLNAEIQVYNNTDTKTSYLVFIGSPAKKTEDIWKKLFKIREEFVVPK